MNGFPTESGKGGEGAEKAHRDGDAPLRREGEVVETKLANASQEKAAHQIHHQCASRKRGLRVELDEPLQGVTGKCPDRPEHDQKKNPQFSIAFRTPPLPNKKLLALVSSQESSVQYKDG